MVEAPKAVTPGGIYDEYQQGVSYNYNIDLYDKVRKNESFFIGNQWEGVDAPDLDKPVFNVLKRVCNMFISQIVSDDITASASTFTDKPGSEEAMLVIGRELERAIRVQPNQAEKPRGTAQCVRGRDGWHLRLF